MEYRHKEKKISGIAIPLSALRTAESPGCGEYPDLVSLGRVASIWKLSMIQLLPLQDTGSSTSPYSALSAFALHPLYIRMSDLPELAEDRCRGYGISESQRQSLLRDVAALHRRYADASAVPHADLYRDKQEILYKIWKCGVSEHCGAELGAWMAGRSWLRAYCAFVELKRRNEGRPWWLWTEYRDPEPEDLDELWTDSRLLDGLRFQAWVQMRADDQLAAATGSLARSGIEVMGDIPILMNEDSAEVWAERRLFHMDDIAGAPPDMYATLGQNWGFPIYDWEALASDGYAFWKSRLAAADAYYSAFRIDHVLGFFRIWALSRHESSGYLGRFVPSIPILRSDLEAAGFNAERIRWLSRPHVRGSWLRDRLGAAGADLAIEATLTRIGSEDLFLFEVGIEGERDIQALGMPDTVCDALCEAWRDRSLFEYESGHFARAWGCTQSTSWSSLSDSEKDALTDLFVTAGEASERLWEREGETILGELCRSVPMLPCAEDLGSVPTCVPVTLERLGILGLRVLRWVRRWDEPKSPYVDPATFETLTVACPSVHDSTVVREWWRMEADRELLWEEAGLWLDRDLGPVPERPGPETMTILLGLVARSASAIAMYPLQDLLALSEKPYAPDPACERINVPGTTASSNWSYRMPCLLEELETDYALALAVSRLATSHDVSA